MKTTALTLASCLLAACAFSPTPHYDARFGDAVRQARTQMIINPDAGKAAAAPVVMDGRAAKEAIGQYEDSYKSPPPAVNVINIGSFGR
jgi:hypothetical protein